MPAIHNNVDGPVRAYAVMLQRLVEINGAKNVAPYTIIIGRDRQHLNPVVHALHTLNSLYYALGFAPEQWLGHLPDQRDVITIQFESDIVKDAEVREHQDLVTHFFDDAGLGFGRESLVGLGEHCGDCYANQKYASPDKLDCFGLFSHYTPSMKWLSRARYNCVYALTGNRFTFTKNKAS